MRQRLRRFFFPPAGSTRFRRYVPWATVFAGFVLMLLIIPPAWEYTNTAEFCGTTCHTMPPEYNTYLVSPHARVPCVDCHIGRDWIARQFLRKSVHLRLIWLQATGNYEYPIRSHELRPARETCERCHFPEKFSDDSLRAANHFFNDEANTPYQLYLLMHTGGGSEREGLGQGIHWHIENRMQYISLDPEQQEIPWVRVYDAQGDFVDYVAIDSEIDLDNLDQYEIRELDCVTCHNRIAHLLPTPRRLIDTALVRGDISSDIPFIRQTAVDAFEENADQPEQARAELMALDERYREEYPAFYEANQERIASAIDVLLATYDENTYPDQKLNWNTHPNNIGHLESPGCFRCHGGKHFSEDGQAVRLECNLCHSIPQVVRPGVIEPMLPLATGFEPTSHLDTTWISRHHLEFNETCSNCHTMEDPGGVSDTSFCSNSGCHGVSWVFAGFDAPELRERLGFGATAPDIPALPDQLAEGSPTYQALSPLFVELCSRCHGDVPAKGLQVTNYDALMRGSEAGPVVVPGSPDESRLITVLEGGHFSPVTDDQLGLLREWIAAGAPEGEPIGGAAVDENAEAVEEPEDTTEDVPGDDVADEAAQPDEEATEPAASPVPASPAPAGDSGFRSYWDAQQSEAGAAVDVEPTPLPASPVPPTATAEATVEFRSYWEQLTQP